MRSITNKNQRGIKRAMPARRVVQSHRDKSVNTHPDPMAKQGAKNADAVFGRANVSPNEFASINTGLSDDEQAGVYNATGGKY